jgi:hypothetical protein
MRSAAPSWARPAAGALIGVGAANVRYSAGYLQRRYDMTYTQCMSAHGNKVQPYGMRPAPYYAYPPPYGY